MRALRLLGTAAGTVAAAAVLTACGSNDPGDETVLEPGPASGESSDDVGTAGGADLVGTTWNLSEVASASGAVTAPEREAFVSFPEEGRVEASSGCNGYGGNATIDGDQVTFDKVIGTQKACEGATGQVDLAFSTMLNGTATVTVTDGALTLTDAEGAVLTFDAASGS